MEGGDGVRFSHPFSIPRDPGVAGFSDIEHIEVLRGPQGTLYGRNSIGGALNIIGKRPSDTFQGEVRGAVGNYGSWRTDALVSAVERAGAEYVAPYVNRLDAQGGDGIATVQELQQLLELHAPNSKVLAASFRTPRQALDCLLAGCQSITLPLDVAEQLLNVPAVDAALVKFDQDWQCAFGR